MDAQNVSYWYYALVAVTFFFVVFLVLATRTKKEKNGGITALISAPAKMSQTPEGRAAAKSLDLARLLSVNQSVYFHVAYVRKYARAGGLTLESIGTSEKNLNALLKRGYEAEAKTCQEAATAFRNASDEAARHLQSYLVELEREGMRPGDSDAENRLRFFASANRNDLAEYFLALAGMYEKWATEIAPFAGADDTDVLLTLATAAS